MPEARPQLSSDVSDVIHSIITSPSLRGRLRSPDEDFEPEDVESPESSSHRPSDLDVAVSQLGEFASMHTIAGMNHGVYHVGNSSLAANMAGWINANGGKARSVREYVEYFLLPYREIASLRPGRYGLSQRDYHREAVAYLFEDWSEVRHARGISEKGRVYVLANRDKYMVFPLKDEHVVIQKESLSQIRRTLDEIDNENLTRVRVDSTAVYAMLANEGIDPFHAFVAAGIADESWAAEQKTRMVRYLFPAANPVDPGYPELSTEIFRRWDARRSRPSPEARKAGEQMAKVNPRDVIAKYMTTKRPDLTATQNALLPRGHVLPE